MEKLDDKILVISAPSGCGKTTLIKMLLEECSFISFSISSTTRNIRENEFDGLDYNFINEEVFKEKINNNDFVEWAKVHNHYYGTEKKEIEKIIKLKKLCLLDIDVQGAINIKKTYPDCNMIFIMPPSIEVLRQRLTERKTNSKEDIEVRINNAEKELVYKDKYDCRIVNDDLKKAYEELKKITLNVYRKAYPSDYNK